MKISFFGANRYSYEILEFLLKNGFDICSISTLPRELSSAGNIKSVKISTYADLGELGDKNNIPVIEISGKVEDYSARISSYYPDLILVFGWYSLLPASIRGIAAGGCVGIHASLLPKYAGGSPLVWALIKGEKETGISLFYLDDGIDTGDIIAQKNIAIEYDDDISSLYDKSIISAKQILLENLPEIEKGTVRRIKQDLSKRTVYPRRNQDDGKISWSMSAEDIRNFIRAQTSPYPGAYSYINGEKMTILASEVIRAGIIQNPTGKICEIEKDGYVVSTGTDYLRLTSFAPESIREIINYNDSFQE